MMRLIATILNVTAAAVWTTMLVYVADASPRMYTLAGFFIVSHVVALIALWRKK